MTQRERLTERLSRLLLLLQPAGHVFVRPPTSDATTWCVGWADDVTDPERGFVLMHADPEQLIQLLKDEYNGMNRQRMT